jgi:hypothetical protein
MAGTLSKRLSTRAERYVHREFARSITESCIQAKVKILQTGIVPGALANFGIGTLVWWI